MSNEDYSGADVLREAAEYLGENGWTQGHLYGEKSEGLLEPTFQPGDRPKACAVGAIRAVCTMRGASWFGDKAEEAEVKLTKHLADCGVQNMDLGIEPPLTMVSIPRWNDDPKTTAEDVILAMKRAAEL